MLNKTKTESSSNDDAAETEPFNSNFFGVCCETGKRYSQIVTRTFHVTNAALVPNPTSEIKDAYVMVKLFRNGDNYLLCSLKQDSIMQASLNLIFDRGENITFYIEGDGVVYLSGYEILTNYPNDLGSNMISKGRHGAFSVCNVNSTHAAETKSSQKRKENCLAELDDSSAVVHLGKKGKRSMSSAKDIKSVPSTSQQCVVVFPDEEDSSSVDGGPSGSGVQPAVNQLVPKGLLSESVVKALTEISDDDDDDEENDEDFNVFDAEAEAEEEEEESDDDINEISDSLDSEDDFDELDNKEESDDLATDTQRKRKRDQEIASRKRIKNDTPAHLDGPSGLSNVEMSKKPIEVFEVDDDDEEEESSSDEEPTNDKNSSITSTPAPSKKSVSKIQVTTPVEQLSSAKNTQLSSKKKKKSQQNKKQDGKSEQSKCIDGIEVYDVRVGYGPPARQGKTLQVYYVGKLPDGKVFDQSVSGNPFSFVLGAGQVIKGWEIGIEGMKVGGKRRMKIPPNLAYGSKGNEDIPPNATISFIVELKSIA